MSSMLIRCFSLWFLALPPVGLLDKCPLSMFLSKKYDRVIPIVSIEINDIVGTDVLSNDVDFWVGIVEADFASIELELLIALIVLTVVSKSINTLIIFFANLRLAREYRVEVGTI